MNFTIFLTRSILILLTTLTLFNCGNDWDYHGNKGIYDRRAAAIAHSMDPNSPESVVPVYLTDDLFPSDGPYKLSDNEKEYLETFMFQRYDEGYYDIERKEKIIDDIIATLDFAKSEDGVTLSDMADQMHKDLTDNLDIWKTGMLEAFQYSAGNSIIIYHEMLNDEQWHKSGLDLAEIEYCRSVMIDIRTIAIDEIQRREMTNDL